MSTNSYKLIKPYPDSPEIDSYICSSESSYYSVRPDLYPEFWQKIDKKEGSLSKDGVLLYEGDACFYVNDFQVKPFYFHLTKDSSDFFKYYVNANEYLLSTINYQCEDKLIEGENVELYGVLNKANWDTRTIMSLQLMRSKHMSTSWKYFSTELARKAYIIENKPVFSLKDIIDHLGKNEEQKDAFTILAHHKIF